MKKMFNKFKKTKLFKRLQKTLVYRAARTVYRKGKKLHNRWNRFYTLRILYPGIYKKNAQKPVDENKVVFIEARMPEITDSFRYMYDELANNYNYDIKVHFLRAGFAKKKEYERLCKAMVADIADAKYVFMNDSSNIISCLPKREETIVTQLWHACGAFKKFGMSTADLIFGDNRKTLEKYPYHRNYTYVTVSSPEIIWAYEEAMSYDDKKGVVVAAGTSRTDYFFDKKVLDKAHKELYRVFPQAEGKKVILYAPTFRGRVAKAKTPNKLDVRMFQEAFGDEYVLVFKHHPFVKKPPKIPAECQDFAIDCTKTMSIEDLLCVSDICISDYSSLVFEYSLFEKPMIFFAYDLDNYYDWRGFYYDYKDFVPGPIYTTNEEMIDYISNVEERFDKQKVTTFRDKFMSSCDGHATERIMKLVFADSLDSHRK